MSKPDAGNLCWTVANSGAAADAAATSHDLTQLNSRLTGWTVNNRQYSLQCIRPNYPSLTALFKGSVMPTNKTGWTFTGTGSSFGRTPFLPPQWLIWEPAIVELGFTGRKSVAWTTEPRLLLSPQRIHRMQSNCRFSAETKSCHRYHTTQLLGLCWQDKTYNYCPRILHISL